MRDSLDEFGQSQPKGKMHAIINARACILQIWFGRHVCVVDSVLDSNINIGKDVSLNSI